MNISQTLKKFLHSGNKPSSTREVSALLDESRSILKSRLPSTAVHVQNLTDADIDGILAGGKTGMMERAAAVHREKQNFTPSNTPSTMQVFTSPNRSKTSAPLTAKPAARPAPTAAASKPAPTIHRASATKPAATPAHLTAAEYATKPLVMKMDEFNKLTPADRMRYVKDGGKLA